MTDLNTAVRQGMYEIRAYLIARPTPWSTAFGGTLGAGLGWYAVPNLLNGRNFNPEWPRIIYAIGLALIGAGIGFVYAAKTVQRQREFRRIGQKLDMRYFHLADPQFRGRLKELLRLLDSRVGVVLLRNVLQKRSGSIQMVVGDLEIRLFHEQDWRSFHTLVFFESDDLNLPEFLLQPRDFWTNVASALSRSQEVDLNSHQGFSRNYGLRGGDTSRIRQCFGKEVLDFFESHPGLQIVARAGQLAVLRSTQEVPPEKLQDFIHEVQDVLKLFRERSA